MNTAIIVAALIFSIPLWLRRWEQNQPTEQEPEEMPDFAILQTLIDEAKEITDELRTLDQMIDDINRCDPESLHTNFICKWATASGTEFKHDFWSTGKRDSAMLLAMAEAERENYRERLLEKIRELSDYIGEPSVSEPEKSDEPERIALSKRRPA